MAAYRPESTVMVRPFARRDEGDEVVIGDPDRQVFLAIPREGLDILDSLAAGHTVRETVRRYEDKHQETPDIDDFLEVLAAEGFVGAPGRTLAAHDPGHSHGPRRQRTVSLDWISPTVARRLSSTPVVLACLAVIGVAVGLFLEDPSVLPGTTVFLFPGGNFALFTVISFAIAAASTTIHELAHAVVARAAGVPVTLGIGTLLYLMVAQTDVSGLRMAPKRQRYLAFLAGGIVDLVFASGLLFVLYAERHGAIHLGQSGVALVGAALLTYLFRVLFQINVAMRTDVYYVIATAVNSGSLLTDTETLLKNVVFRLLRRRHRIIDQSGLTARERRMTRLYAVVWLVGRALAFMALFFIFLPALVAFAVQFGLFLSGHGAHLGSLDFLTAGALALLIQGGGIVMWLRSVYSGHMRRRAERRGAAARPTVAPLQLVS